MSFCTNCGSSLAEGSQFCGSCGRQQAGAPAGTYAAAGEMVQQGNAGSAAIISVICSVVALAILPPIFGGIAIWQALRVKKYEEGKGTALLAVAIVCTVVGMIFGVLWWTGA